MCAACVSVTVCCLCLVTTSIPLIPLSLNAQYVQEYTYTKQVPIRSISHPRLYSNTKKSAKTEVPPTRGKNKKTQHVKKREHNIKCEAERAKVNTWYCCT